MAPGVAACGLRVRRTVFAEDCQPGTADGTAVSGSMKRKATSRTAPGTVVESSI